MKELQRTLNLRKRTPAQRRYHESTARFNVGCWGRQSGKTTSGNDKMIYRPLQGRVNGVYWYVLQTYSAASVAFDRMARLLYGTGLSRKRPNESEMCIFLENGANVFYKSGDKPQNLRAETLDGAIVDECRQQKKELWTQILYPMLGRYNGWCDFFSTPNGFDWFHDLYEMALNKNPNGEWAAFHAPSTESWWWTEAQVQQARAQMSESEFAQEILAEFRDLQHGQAYHSFGGWNLKMQNPLAQLGEVHSPYLPIELYMDFNVLPLSWVYGQFREGIGHHFTGELFFQTRASTREGIKEFISRIDWTKQRAEHQVILIGDASGNAGKTSASGATDYTIIEEELTAAGVRFANMTPDSNPPVKDRVNTVNTRLLSADGSSQITMNPNACPNLVEDFRRTVWKLGASATLDQTTDRMRTHLSDGVGYGVCIRNPIKKLTDAGYVRILAR